LVFKVPYRTVQGIVRGLSDTKECTHIRRRILKINPSVRIKILKEEEREKIMIGK
jgi:hypothetical protein